MLAPVLFAVIYSVVIQASVVHIEQGALQGTTLKSRNGLEFYGFYGIPYAQAPVGNLRFQPPTLPPPSWQGTKNATVKPPFCPQMNPMIRHGFKESEDCLYLQVFTQKINPDADNTTLMPVLVWFHGGAFKMGGSTMNEPNYFMDKPIVMVMVNSRLGIFGFFSTGDASYPGNYGLKDQTAALQWVQKNIRSFGGDPSTVTIMGHSSGSASVHFHTLSPLSKGIFHRAILHSGTANMFWSITQTDTARRNFHSFKQHANCSKPSTSESVACLLTLPVKDLTQLASTYQDVDARPFPFNPVIEPFGSEGVFLPSDPTRQLDYLDSQIPLMFGFTSNEQLTLGTRHLMNITNEKLFDSMLLEALFYKPRPDRESLAKNTTSLVKQIYFGNNLANNTFKTATMIISDLQFRLAILDSIRNHPNRVFAFKYDYRDSPFFKEFGVGHGGELKMLLPLAGFMRPLTDEEKKVSETMMIYWSNFIMTGDPNTPNKTLPSDWSKAKTSFDEHLHIMHISNNGFQMEGDSFEKEAELWSHYTKVCWG